MDPESGRLKLGDFGSAKQFDPSASAPLAAGIIALALEAKLVIFFSGKSKGCRSII